MPTYQDIYPSEPLLRSADLVRPRAGELLSLEYFEAPAARMPTQVFDQHHILINLKPEPMRVENWRDGEHRDFIYRANEIVVTPAGLESGWHWHETSQVIVVTLDPAKFERFAQSEVGVLLTGRQLKDLPQFEDADICMAARMLLDALQLGGTGSEVMFESLARVFLVKLVQRYGEEGAKGARFNKSYGPAAHRRVLDLVSGRFAEALQIEDLAQAAGLSQAHFARQFKAVIGESPYRFLMRYRVERAAEFLIDPQRPMIDIALACGFSDQPHLSRLFREFRGETPKQWRTRHQA